MLRECGSVFPWESRGFWNYFYIIPPQKTSLGFHHPRLRRLFLFPTPLPPPCGEFGMAKPSRVGLFILKKTTTTTTKKINKPAKQTVCQSLQTFLLLLPKFSGVEIAAIPLRAQRAPRGGGFEAGRRLRGKNSGGKKKKKQRSNQVQPKYPHSQGGKRVGGKLQIAQFAAF